MSQCVITHVQGDEQKMFLNGGKTGVLLQGTFHVFPRPDTVPSNGESSQ